MASGKIESNSRIDITSEALNMSGLRTNNCVMHKRGNMRELYLNGSLNNALTVETLGSMGTIAAGNIPPQHLTFVIRFFESETRFISGMAIINKDTGEITCSIDSNSGASVSMRQFRGHVTYFV